MNKNITIFCGSKKGNSEFINDTVIQFCDLLIENNFDLIYGGSHHGMMGMVARRFLEGGRKVTGIRAKHSIHGENYKGDLTEMIITENMSERKSKMLEISDTVVALPGGIGTLDEITEAQCYFAVHKIVKFIGIFNCNQFYDGLIQHYYKMDTFGFTSKRFLEQLSIEDDPRKMIQRILGHHQNMV